MACLREQTTKGRIGIVQCDEEGCEFRSFSIDNPAAAYAVTSPTDCVLQLRLRTRIAENLDEGRGTDEDREFFDELERRGENDQWFVPLTKEPISYTDYLVEQTTRDAQNHGFGERQIKEFYERNGIKIHTYTDEGGPVGAHDLGEGLQPTGERSGSERVDSGDQGEVRVRQVVSEESPTPREEFEQQFGSITDEKWQWFKEFVKKQPTLGEHFDIDYNRVALNPVWEHECESFQGLRIKLQDYFDFCPDCGMSSPKGE